MSEISLNQNSSSFYSPSPLGATAIMRHSSAATRSKPELKVGKFVEEDDGASQGESSDRLSVGSMSTAYWRVNSLAIVGAAIALISVFLPWWGIYELVGSSVMLFAHWTLWSPPGSAVLRRLGRPRFPINSKRLSDIHHFQPHSADSSPGRGITRPRWRPHSRPEILGSWTGSVNLNTNRLHLHYSLRDIQLWPIVPPMRIRTHRKWNSLRNHGPMGDSRLDSTSSSLE